MAKKSLTQGWLNKYQAGGYYEIKKGDSLWDISQALNIPFEKLIAANPNIDDPNMIYEGQKISLPAGSTAPAVRPVVKAKQEQPVLKSMTMPAGTIRGSVAESTSQPMVTRNGVTMTGYQPEVKVSRPLSAQSRQRIEEARAQLKAEDLRKKIEEKPPHPGYPVDNTATQIYNPGISYTVQDANGKSRVVQVEKPSLTSTASINAADPGYMAPKEMDWADYAGMGIGALATALPLGIAALETAPAAFAGLESAMAMPLYSSAPAWATVGNALTAASIPAVAEAISYLPQDVQSGNLSGFLHHGTEAALGLFPFAHAASEAGYIDDAGRILGTAANRIEKIISESPAKIANKLSSSYESLKKDANFVKLLATNPTKAATELYTNHRPLYNKIFDKVNSINEFTKNPIEFMFGKGSIAKLTPEISQAVANAPNIPEEMQTLLGNARIINKEIADAQFYSKAKNLDPQKELTALRNAYQKGKVLSEEDFFWANDRTYGKEYVVKRINKLEKQLGLPQSKLTYTDADNADIINLDKYNINHAPSNGEIIQPVYPATATSPNVPYIMESHPRFKLAPGERPSAAVKQNFRFAGEELTPNVRYNPGNPETHPIRVFKRALEKFEGFPSGQKAVTATSLSTDSKPMELKQTLKMLEQGKLKDIKVQGMGWVNEVGSTNYLPRKASVDEINSYIDKVNMYLTPEKKLPHAVLHANGDIWAPQIVLTKKAYGGWLDTYQLAGPVMPPDVMMDPRKLAEWIKDHPEASVQNANKRVLKDPRAVQVDPRLLKNTPKVVPQQGTVDYPASDPRSQSYTGAPATTLLMNPNQVQGEGARIIEGGNNLPILAAATAPVVAPAVAPLVAPAEGAANAYFGYEGANAAVQAYNDFSNYDYDQGLIHSGQAVLGLTPFAQGAWGAANTINEATAPYIDEVGNVLKSIDYANLKNARFIPNEAEINQLKTLLKEGKITENQYEKYLGEVSEIGKKHMQESRELFPYFQKFSDANNKYQNMYDAYTAGTSTFTQAEMDAAYNDIQNNALELLNRSKNFTPEQFNNFANKAGYYNDELNQENLHSLLTEQMGVDLPPIEHFKQRPLSIQYGLDNPEEFTKNPFVLENYINSKKVPGDVRMADYSDLYGNVNEDLSYLENLNDNAGTQKAIKDFVRNFRSQPSGYDATTAFSLSTDSYPQTIKMMKGIMKNDIDKVKFHGYAGLNSMGWPTKGGVPQVESVKEINNVLKEYNATDLGKANPLPYAYIDDLGYIKVPLVSFVRKQFGGKISKGDVSNWLTKYK